MCYGRGHTGSSTAGTTDSIGLKAGSTSKRPPSREGVAWRVRVWVPACVASTALLQPSKTSQPPAQTLQRLPNTQRRKYKFSTTASVTRLIAPHALLPHGLSTLRHCAKLPLPYLDRDPVHAPVLTNESLSRHSGLHLKRHLLREGFPQCA